MADDSTRGLVKPWHVGPSREIARTRIFTLKERRCTSASDPKRSGEFVYLECPDWINVIALTPDRQVVMVEQFRFGTLDVTLEIPGGIVDPGETPEAACARELLEETAHEGSVVRMIGRVAANPAINTNHVHTGLVTEARVVRGSLELDEHEEIGVRLVPLGEIAGLIRSGAITHSFVVAAFQFLGLEGSGS